VKTFVILNYFMYKLSHSKHVVLFWLHKEVMWNLILLCWLTKYPCGRHDEDRPSRLYYLL
jgi:hypothetical protein